MLPDTDAFGLFGFIDFLRDGQRECFYIKGNTLRDAAVRIGDIRPDDSPDVEFVPWQLEGPSRRPRATRIWRSSA